MKRAERKIVKIPRVDRVLVLGVDGLDPGILERLMDLGSDYLFHQ